MKLILKALRMMFYTGAGLAAVYTVYVMLPAIFAYSF
jgi:hypothetical protein